MATKLVVIILNHPENLEDVLEGLLEIGVSGATVIDSVGMGRILSHDVPIFAGLRKIFPSLSPDNKTILIVTQETLINDIMAVAEETCGSLDQPGAGLAFVIPIDFVKGLRPGL
jgi:nitrogen regulatory protein PII